MKKQTIGFIGLGLIGGSIAKSLKNKLPPTIGAQKREKCAGISQFFTQILGRLNNKDYFCSQKKDTNTFTNKFKLRNYV